jgi:GAF domain-containing protein
VALVELADVRTCLFVPLRKDNELFGAFVMCREQVQPFTDRQKGGGNEVP